MKNIPPLTTLFLLLICVPFIGWAVQPEPGATGEVSIRLKGIDGKKYNTADLRGNVIVVSFGATWCGACDQELAALEQLKKEYEGKPVKFLSVNIESGDAISSKELKAYAQEQGLTLPVLRDTDKSTYAQFAGMVSPEMKQNMRTRVPLLVLINQSGGVVLPGQFGMPSPEIYKKKVRGRLDSLLTTGMATAVAR